MRNEVWQAMPCELWFLVFFIVGAIVNALIAQFERRSSAGAALWSLLISPIPVLAYLAWAGTKSQPDSVPSRVLDRVSGFLLAFFVLLGLLAFLYGLWGLR